MKHIKLFTLLIIAMITIISISGCGNNNDKIVGTYYSPIEGAQTDSLQEITINKKNNQYSVQIKNWYYNTENSNEKYHIHFKAKAKDLIKTNIEVENETIKIQSPFNKKMLIYNHKDDTITGPVYGTLSKTTTYKKSKTVAQEYINKMNKKLTEHTNPDFKYTIDSSPLESTLK